jgi:IS30 family transposase
MSLFCVLDQKLQNMSHLTVEQRYTIERMIQQGYKQIEIARCIAKHKSVVSRELKRNCDQRSGKYKSDLAQRKYNHRNKTKPKCIVFDNVMKSKVGALLKDDYSPEQVCGKLREQGKQCVSHERIYQHIWEDKKQGGTLHTHLRNQGRRYRKRGAAKDKRGLIVGRVDIEKRPKIVEERSRFGDLEVDLIIGKNHKSAILTINDRASGMLKMRKVKSKEAWEVSRAIVSELEDWKPYIKTITADNGKEFANHQYVAQELQIDHYFAKPYHSWERGSNENLNGLVRQYFKKKDDFNQLSDQQIKFIENKLNNRPRKRFKYKTPIFVMEELLFNQKVAFVT